MVEDRRRWLRDLSNRRLILDIPVEQLTDEELDRHMDMSHDRDSGERGMGRLSAELIHSQLHRTGVWIAVPHTHDRTLPFNPWVERLRRKVWLWRYKLTHLRQRPQNMLPQTEHKGGKNQ